MLGFLLSVRDQLEIFLRLLLIRVARAHKAFTTISQPHVYFPASSHRYYPLGRSYPPPVDHPQRLGTDWAQRAADLALRMRGPKLQRAFAHTDMNRARLPIPPHPREAPLSAAVSPRFINRGDPYYCGTRRTHSSGRLSGKPLLIAMGRAGIEPATLGLRGGGWDLGRSRSSWETSDFEPISAA